MKNNALTMIQLDVSHDDIREMYDQFDSGMCDVGTANAVSIALKRRLRTKYTPRVIFASHHNACKLRINEDSYPLPQNLYWWLRNSKSGVEVTPSRFSLAIPPFLLRKRAR